MNRYAAIEMLTQLSGDAELAIEFVQELESKAEDENKFWLSLSESKIIDSFRIYSSEC